MDLVRQIWVESGLYQISGGQAIMLVVCLGLLYLGIVRKFEPLLLVTIGFGGLLSNIPGAGIAEPGGLLYLAYEVGIKSGAFPLIIFMGVGALTDFGPLLANPRTLFLGAAAQFGIFATLLGRNAINLQAPAHASYIIHGNQVLAELPVVVGQILDIDETSNSEPSWLNG